MTKPTNDSQKEVKVEDLLRLKRAERPDEAFWGKFDRELHQRMMQTLVKKDPIHLQIWRALSARFTQSVGVAAAAAFLALMVVRPAFLGSTGASDVNLAQEKSAVFTEIASAEASVSEMNLAALEATRDYSIEGISAEVQSQDATFTRDFGMDGFELAMDADFSSDAASARLSFGNTGVAATLVF